MKSQSSSQIRQENIGSQVFEEGVISVPRINSMIEQPNKRYIKYEQVLKNQFMVQQKQEEEYDHKDCKSISISIDSNDPSNKNNVDSDALKEIRSDIFVIDRELNACCHEIYLEMKLLIRRNTVFSIYKVHGEQNKPVGIRYMLQNSKMMIKLTVLLLEDGEELIWKEIQIPEENMEIHVPNAITLKEKPNHLIDVLINGYSFSFKMPHEKHSTKIALKGNFKIQKLELNTHKYEQIESKKQCSMFDCRLF